MSRLAFLEGLALPVRIFLEAEREPIPDPDGFILPIGTPLAPKEVLKQSAVLAVAPPWTGKTTVARGIYNALREHPFSALTCFEEWVHGASVEPSWWSSWKTGEDDAFWIVDAVDEDARKESQSLRILQLLRELPEEALARLHLLAFCRINEIPERFEIRLEEIYGRWEPDQPLGLRRLRLAGLDRENARAHVRPGRFERVCQLLRDNDLRTLAPFPAVLSYLAESPEEQNLTQDKVWEGVLKNLLREQRDRNEPLHPSFRSEVEDRFAVAQRLAALTTFCGIEPVRADTGLENLFPSSLPAYAELRVAARETWKTSIFERSDRGYRFSQDHVRQWLTAFALRGMNLRQIRPLLALESGELDPSHEGVAGLLYQISLHEEVKRWLVDVHGGLPGGVGTAWSLPDAARALDRLQEIARSSPWGLSPWRDERLRSFSQVPGIGTEIARRLDLDLHPAEQQLLLELALVIDAPEPVGTAIQVLLDGHWDERVRERAASLVAALGSVEQLAPLASWIEASQEEPGKAVLSNLEVAFYEKGLWSFEKAAERALSRRSLRNDWLQYRLSSDLTPDRARWLIQSRLRPDPENLPQHLLKRAVEKTLERKTPEEADIEVLVPLLLEHGDFDRGGQIRRFLERSPAARRRLFHEGLSRDPQCEGNATWVWRGVLEGEDIEWLLGLSCEPAGRPVWLETLFFLSHRKGVPTGLRRRARQMLRRTDGEKLKVWDHERQSWQRAEEERRREADRERAQDLELEALVRETLYSAEIDLRSKMHRLSRCCFEPPSQRPSNVRGRWEDLSAELCAEVLAVCRKALAQCPPTPIPLSSSFSRWTRWEAACFDRISSEDTGFTLTPEMIQKWLPALLRAWVTGAGFGPTLRRCFEVDSRLTEDLFAEAVRRSVLAEKSTYILQNLPRELWSERFSGLLEAMVADPEVTSEMRIDLLVRIAEIFPVRVCPIALAWAESSDAALRDAGVDLLLAVLPEEGWRSLKTLVERENPKEVLLRMRSLLPHHYGPSASFEAWPPEQVAALEELLLTCFPPEKDPQWEEGEVRSLGEEDDLRSVRDHLPQILYRRDGEGDHRAVEDLAARHLRIREWLDDVRAYQGAESVISGLGRSAHSTGAGRKVPLTLMLKLLQDSRYRVLGSVDDLLDVVQEQLEVIAREAKQHLSLLYHPRSKKKGEERKRLHEDALQAYLHCRLTDRLPGILEAQGVKVAFVDRETLAARDTRNDLKIQASSYGGKPVTLIIEVKWSDNSDVSTNLVTQLGEDYLLRNNLTHGLYLVGWSGTTAPWKSAWSPGPDPRSSRDACQEALAVQAANFCQAHPGLRIAPVVIDLTWELEPAPAT